MGYFPIFISLSLYYCESSVAPCAGYIFLKGLRRMKNKPQKTAMSWKSCGCTNKSPWQPLHCFVPRYSQSGTGISSGPPLTSPPPKKRCNHCKLICKVYGLMPQTCPFCSHKGNVWRNKWSWTLRRHISMGADTAAQGQQPREGKILQTFRINYTFIDDLRCTTFRTFSVCLISKVLAASRGAQLLQMLPFNSQVPLSVLWAPETVLTAPTDVSWTTWLTVLKKRKQSSWGW